MSRQQRNQDSGQFMHLEKIVIPPSKVRLLNESFQWKLEKHASVLVWMSGQSEGSQACDKILEICGLRQNVDNAKEIVKYFLSHKHYPWKEGERISWKLVAIPTSKVHLVIGENEEKVDLLKEKGHVLIYVSGGGDKSPVGDRTLWIYGPASNVLNLERLLRFLMDKDYIGQPWQWEEIVIPESKSSETVLSWGWRQLETLEKKTLARTWIFSVAEGDDESSKCYKVLHILGEENTAQRLKKLAENSLFYEIMGIDKDLDGGDKEDADKKQITKTKTSIPAFLVFGRGAKKLMEVEVKTEVTILVKSFVDSPSKAQELVILGLQHNVMKATKMIRDLMSDADYGTDEPALMI